MAWLRDDFRWIGRAAGWVEALHPTLDTVHILLFAALAALSRLAWPAMRWGRLLLRLVLFSAVSELVQFWAPGREPLWSDFWQDLMGVALGLAPFALWKMIGSLRAGKAAQRKTP